MVQAVFVGMASERGGMMEKTKLLNCPFCGGEAKMQRIINLDDFDDFFIMCEKCFSRTKKFKAERSAILVWNTRKPMERILERLETEDMALFNAINKYQKKMYTDGDALDKVRMLQHKQLSNHKAIEIVKEEGEAK